MSDATHTSDSPRHRYDAAMADRIERRWQAQWAERKTYQVGNPGDPGFDASRPKFYCLDMFPYPSGAGLHVGHPEGYTATDIICRYRRMKGFNVLHPMGWDAFGLPAEQYAIQTGVHPAITTRNSIDNFRRQLQRFGFCYDWSREFGTIDPEYYKWTQWIFLRIYNAWFDKSAPGGGRARPIAELIDLLEHGRMAVNPYGEPVTVATTPGIIAGEPVGVRMWHELTQEERRNFIDNQRLAYIGETTVNWCPRLGTVLANDEVIDGRSERGGHPVLRKPLRQWMFRITAYADRLLRQLDGLDWPESTKTMQREWIGRSEGAEIDFEIAPGAHQSASLRALRVFTTRPDTIFGATYMVIAPEHELVDEIMQGPEIVEPGTDVDAIGRYVSAARNRSELERQADTKDKSGVFSGLYCINPATGNRIPIWIADYVLMGYGTGAIMAVPAHDERDWEFASSHNLPRPPVVSRTEQQDEGVRFELQAGELTVDKLWRLLGSNDFGILHWNSSPIQVDDITCEDQATAQRLLAQLSLAPRKLQKAPAVRGLPFSGEGFAINSANGDLSLNGLPTAEAKDRIIAWLEANSVGVRRVNFRLRDWTFSRQRYWGEPFPIVFDDAGNHYPVGESALPVRLPELADYKPIESDDPMPLLAKAGSWVRTTAAEAGVDPDVLPPSTPVTRETNTMPGSAGSSWYFLRYCDPRNPAACASRSAADYWMNVDLYLGGSEHAVGHLLYSRFWTSVLFDLGIAPAPEPFKKLFHQGLITSFAYQRADKSLVPVDEVDESSEGVFVERATGKPVAQIVAKMSKSLKNVANPDDVIAEFGADTFRLYEMYMGPLEASKPWNPRDITGLFRFLQRLWRLCVNEDTGAIRVAAAPDDKLERQLHRLIKKVGDDIDRLAFNTAIATMIEFVNAAIAINPQDRDAGALTPDQISRLMRTLSPFAPHLAEEIWQMLPHATRVASTSAWSVVEQPWPDFDPAMLQDSEIEVPVSLLGKVRHRITVPAAVATDIKALEAAAMADAKVIELIAGRPIRKVIVIPGKMVNIVHG